MSKHVKYQNLKTIDDVRKERMRINHEISQREWLLHSDLESLTEVFTLDYWSNKIMRQVGSVPGGTLEKFAFGYELFNAIAGRWRKRKTKKAKRKKKKKQESELVMFEHTC